MEDLLFRVDITSQIIYLSLILLVIGNGLKDIPFIKKWMIIWILLIISITVEFVFVNVSFNSLFEAVIAASLSTMIYQLYKQAKKGIKELRTRK
ncbi:MAG: phage holin family protein [Bacilli bacterium]|nr:phage holin family protein [Bacilli bacterium]MDD4298218.1 phage holin family protein [Bacilli bacterium]MDD4643469.1 phage holin family protein [Bacilli bacterium]